MLLSSRIRRSSLAALLSLLTLATGCASSASGSESSQTDSTTVTTAEVTTTPPTETTPAVTDFFEAPANTPVALHGQLSVDVNQLVDENGNPYQLRGMSTHGITWYPDYVCEETFASLRDDWKTNCVRVAMYVDEKGNSSTYLKNKEESEALMLQGIDAAIKLGLYVIVDWHVLNPGDPTAYTEEAKAFFEMITERYSNYENIIYEICNEPNGTGITWNEKIRPYCVELIDCIRKTDDDAVIIAGTGNWCQEINLISGSLLEDKNTMYALHFYAATHGNFLMQRVASCYEMGIPIFVSEFGTCEADGEGGIDTAATDDWLDLLDSMNISYMNWALANKKESCCAFSSLSDALSGWQDIDLSESGKYVRDRYISRAEALNE